MAKINAMARISAMAKMSDNKYDGKEWQQEEE